MRKVNENVRALTVVMWNSFQIFSDHFSNEIDMVSSLCFFSALYTHTRQWDFVFVVRQQMFRKKMRLRSSSRMQKQAKAIEA